MVESTWSRDTAGHQCHVPEVDGAGWLGAHPDAELGPAALAHVGRRPGTPSTVDGGVGPEGDGGAARAVARGDREVEEGPGGAPAWPGRGDSKVVACDRLVAIAVNQLDKRAVGSAHDGDGAT